MKLAIQAADLDHERIDGTRVYILNLLRHFGALDPLLEFFLYHRGDFNPELKPPEFTNYRIKKIAAPFMWTQTRFAREVWKDRPDVLWMPMAAIPLVRRKQLKTVVTIHDLAFKYFPEYFTAKDFRKLNFMADLAIRKSDGIIAISEATKKDILKFYPAVKAEKIKVIYHGFTGQVFSGERDFAEENALKKSLGINGEYILYSGAIQPRKNLEALIRAFEIYKIGSKSEIKLVLAGEKAWLWQGIEKMAKDSRFCQDIVMPGKLKFGAIGHLFRGARVFVQPAFYEGFGITVLEAMAAKIPVILANNSSLPEVGGEAALYFAAADPSELAGKIKRLLTDEKLRAEMVAKGLEQVKKFSWDKCAQETLKYLKGVAAKA